MAAYHCALGGVIKLKANTLQLMVEYLNVSAYINPSLYMQANKMTVIYIEIFVYKDT